MGEGAVGGVVASVFASSSLPSASILLKGLRFLGFRYAFLFDLSQAGSYQQRVVGGSDGKKSVAKVCGGGGGGKLGDQPVVFHKSIKSSGYGKEQPVRILLPLPPLLPAC